METSAIPKNFTVLLPSPPVSEDQRSYNLSTLGAILCLLGLVAIPTLIYAFFFALTCPTNRSRRPESSIRRTSLSGKMELISEVKCMKEIENGMELQGGECPVCLSAFAEGEEIRQLKVCGHSFHVACIDMWLFSHSNCPVCRASIPLKCSSKQPVPVVVVVDHHDDDLRQGLPNSANLI